VLKQEMQESEDIADVDSDAELEAMFENAWEKCASRCRVSWTAYERLVRYSMVRVWRKSWY
jgi:hypothetical protein